MEFEESPEFRRHMLESRLQILNAMVSAIERRQELMDLVAAASDPDEARRRLQAAFSLDEVQAQAILDLQLLRFSEQMRARMVDERNSLSDQLGSAG